MIPSGSPVMPDIEEIQIYEHVKRAAGWIEYPVDKLLVRGADRLDLLQRLATNDIKALKPGEGDQTVLITEKARIIDVLTILARDTDLVVVLSSGMQEQVTKWLDKYTIMDDFKVENITGTWGAILVTGPDSPHILHELTGEQLAMLSQFHWKQCSLFGAEVMIARYLTVCEFSYLLLFREGDRAAVIDGLHQAGGSLPEMTRPVLDILQIEAGLGQVGAEWTDEYNPLEAGLVRIISFKKGCYIGQEVVARLDSYNKVKQHLVGCTSEQPIPVGAEFHDETRLTGKITRSTFSPELQKYIAIGYIRTAYANPGTKVTATHNGREFPLDIVKLPFTM
jgi:folate-binding protein YgfZ